MCRQWKPATSLVCLLALGSLGAFVAPAETYPVSTEYTQSVDLILDESDLNSGGWSHKIDWIDASGDGETVVFWTVAEKTGEPSQRHMFVVGWDGTGLREITPTGSTEAMTYPRFPRLNYDGSRMFFNANNYNDMFYINTASGALVHVCDTPGGPNFRKPFQINRDGTGMYFYWDDPVDSDCDSVGIYYCGVGGTPTRVLGLHELPFDDYCNRNRISFLGASDAGRGIISWKTADYCTDCTSMFLTDGGGTRLPDEAVSYVYSLQDLPHRQISRDGSRCLYHSAQSRDDGGNDWALELINPDAGTRTMLMDSGKCARPAISPDGDYVRFNSHAGAYATLMDVSSGGPGEMRDTISYYTNLLDSWTLSNICDDNLRWFGYSAQDWGAQQKLYRYNRYPDADAGEYGDCPRILEVAWSRPALLNDATMTVAAYVTVSDPQGLGNIEWVGVYSQTDYGREKVEWDIKGRDPLSAGGDMSGTRLDDEGAAGEVGDAQANDGVYTFDGFYTRDYCDFWDHYASHGFPIDIPIRVIVKDVDHNYTFVDTFLTITDDPSEAEPGGDTGGDGDDDGSDDDGWDDDGWDDDGDPNSDGGWDDPNDGGWNDPNDGGWGDPNDGGGWTPPPVSGLCPATGTLMLSLTIAGLLYTRGRPRSR